MIQIHRISIPIFPCVVETCFILRVKNINFPWLQRVMAVHFGVTVRADTSAYASNSVKWAQLKAARILLAGCS